MNEDVIDLDTSIASIALPLHSYQKGHSAAEPAPGLTVWPTPSEEKRHGGAVTAGAHSSGRWPVAPPLGRKQQLFGPPSMSRRRRTGHHRLRSTCRGPGAAGLRGGEHALPSAPTRDDSIRRPLPSFSPSFRPSVRSALRDETQLIWPSLSGHQPLHHARGAGRQGARNPSSTRVPPAPRPQRHPQFVPGSSAALLSRLGGAGSGALLALGHRWPVNQTEWVGPRHSSSRAPAQPTALTSRAAESRAAADSSKT